MSDGTLDRWFEEQAALQEMAVAWREGMAPDEGQVERAHESCARLAHAHYMETIPAYKRWAEEAGRLEVNGIADVLSDLMSTDDIFKSYQPEWLDVRDFVSMTRWIRSIYHAPIEEPEAGVSTIDGWLGHLAAHGLAVEYSSGTSGRFSFLPRDERTWGAFLASGSAVVFSELSRRKVDLADIDAFFLGFRGGNQGFQKIGEVLSNLVARIEYLFDFAMDAETVRALVRGPRSRDEEERVLRLKEETVDRSRERFERIADSMKRTVASGRRMILLGAPFQLRELCEVLASRSEALCLRPGSVVAHGGGWKSFEGKRISPEDLSRLLAERLGVAPGDVFEGYAMSEINTLFIRCSGGRFHVPPSVRPALFRDDLSPIGDAGEGIFGFLDPFATSYPGFLISGDLVRLVRSPCACGRTGLAIEGEVTRAKGREVKGCGGLMASVQA